MTRVRKAGMICGYLTATLLLAASATASSDGSDQAGLARLSNEWMSAVERKDRATLERIVASDFTLRMPGDAQERTVRRDEWIANAMGMDWSGFRYENLEARVNGDQAIVTSHLQFNVAPFPVALDSGVVDIWHKREGRWQVTNRYLGESTTQLRIAFFAGVLLTIVAGLAGYLLVRLVRRRRKLRSS